MKGIDIEQQEQRRLILQAQLDGKKTPAERNRLGQFATPTALAEDILRYANKIFPSEMRIRFLDPAVGTGSFYSAFLRTAENGINLPATGFEIDSHYGLPACELWKKYPLDIRLEDFTKAETPGRETEKATLVICNPPYVRHHYIQNFEKERLQRTIFSRHGLSFSGLSGLYCYFLCLSKDWMARDGIAGWLIPSEFMDVNYGRVLKDFLLRHVTLLHIHRFSPDDVQFGDALVSSAIIWFKNAVPPENHRVKFTFGGSLLSPIREKEYSIDFLAGRKKWTSLPESGCRYGDKSTYVLGDFFDVKRGIATGANDFFVLSREDVCRRRIPPKFLIPILPSPRYLKSDIIECDAEGVPQIDRCKFLFSSELPEDQIQKDYPDVWKYLQEGREQGIMERYLCRNRQPWYLHEKRNVTPFLCTYMGRLNGNGESRPFRFILNRSQAIAANVYLMLYLKPWVLRKVKLTNELIVKIWQAICDIPTEHLLNEGRVYGGGLYKLEPRELLNAPSGTLTELLPENNEAQCIQMALF